MSQEHNEHNKYGKYDKHNEQKYISQRAKELKARRQAKHNVLDKTLQNYDTKQQDEQYTQKQNSQTIPLQITKAIFIKSASKMSESLDNLSQIAFLGRSNVGKSTLINSLTNTKNLAKISNTPGKTKLINFFEISFNQPKNFKLHLVDLPGFGYAKVSKTQKEAWQKTLNEFLLQSGNIKLFVLLIDSRHTNLQNDVNVLEFIQKHKSPNQGVVKVYTKTDKLKKNELRILKNKNQGHFFVSSYKKDGLGLLRTLIHEVSL